MKNLEKPSFNTLPYYHPVGRIPFVLFDGDFIMENNEEIWKDVIGYEGHYQASNFGRIKSLKSNNELILAGGFDKRGYHIVSLLKDKIQKTKTIHRLVAMLFIPNPQNKRTVNHINGIKSDNRVINLEWNTYSENHLHAFNKLKRITRSRPIIQMDKNNNIINKFNSIKDAAIKNRLRKSGICLCLKEKYKTSGGFKWNYQ